jgi:hypothetical protein
MPKSKTNTDPAQKKNNTTNSDELFEKKFYDEDEIDSDGSASAFDETEQVNEDNFDNLSEK